MEKEYDIDSLISSMDFESSKLQDIGNGLFLTKKEVQILEQYKIPYKNCHSLKEVLFEIEEVLNDMDIVDEELDMVSSSISERDYYQNTNK
jgi:hypothetical protein